jgi:hypothetical protein
LPLKKCLGKAENSFSLREAKNASAKRRESFFLASLIKGRCPFENPAISRD